MFLLDSNTISELLRPSPDPFVETWTGDCAAADLYFSAVDEAELCYSVPVLPVGRHQTALAFAIEAILREDCESRILSFDCAVARTLMRTLWHCVVRQADPSPQRTVKPRRQPDPAAWPSRRATFGTSMALV